MNLHEKLIELRRGVPYLQKDTKGYNYSYVSGTSVLEKLQPKMNELGIVLFTETGPITRIQEGKETQVFAQFRFTWIDAATGDKITLDFCGGGQDPDISKAIGKMLTYTERYFLLKSFNVPTDSEDPDAHQEAPKSEHRESKPAQKPAGELTMWMGKSKGQPVSSMPIDQLESAIAWCKKNDKFLDKAAELEAYINTYHSTPGAPINQSDDLPF